VRFLFDESTDAPVAQRLRSEGHAVLCAWEMEPGLPDDRLLMRANDSAALLVTSDKDFGELVFRQHRATAGVVLLRLGGLSNPTKARLVSRAIREHGEELTGAFTVIGPGTVRIRRHP
jgi:predicted nuclease of predicted toxin-antitoxin system